MKKIGLLLFIGMLCLCGCTTLTAVERRFGRIVLTDGIDVNEAKTIAQHEYLRGQDRTSYKVSSPRVYGEEDILGAKSDQVPFVNDQNIYSDYKKKLKFSHCWYVVLKPKLLSFFSNYYLVVINKSDGSVQYSYDSNAFGELFQAVFTSNIEPKLSIIMAASRFYAARNVLPEDFASLKKFIDEHPTMNGPEFTLQGTYQVQRISPTKLKIIWDPPESSRYFNELLSPEGETSLFQNEFEVEFLKENGRLNVRAKDGLKMTFQINEFAK